MDRLSNRRRVLLMYISKVSGHRQATAAIQRALRSMDPRVEAPSINGFAHTFPILEKLVNQMYMTVIHTAPFIWEKMYDNPKLVANTGAIKNYLHRRSHDKIEELMERFRPDTVVCTQAFPCGMVAEYKRRKKLDINIVGVLTDYAPHSFWINSGVDHYIVPDQDVKDQFLQKGMSPDRIKVYGIPIRAKFAQQLDKHPIAEQLDLDLTVPVVLIMGGGQGLGPIRSVVDSLDQLDTPVQMIVITGINRKLIQWLDQRKNSARKRIIAFEYANNVDELMEVANLIVTKPGGLTTSESLAKGLPMVIVNPLPGQEKRNTDFLVNNGIGISIEKGQDIAQEIEKILCSPQRLREMSRNAYAHSKPHAALDIARLIIRDEIPEPAGDLILNDV